MVIVITDEFEKRPDDPTKVMFASFHGVEYDRKYITGFSNLKKLSHEISTHLKEHKENQFKKMWVNRFLIQFDRASGLLK